MPLPPLCNRCVVNSIALALTTLAANVVEGAVSVAFATEASWDGDFSLLGFGLDSFVEVLSAALVLLQLSTSVRDAASGWRTARPWSGMVPASVFAIAATDVAISMCRQASRHTLARASGSRVVVFWGCMFFSVEKRIEDI